MRLVLCLALGLSLVGCVKKGANDPDAKKSKAQVIQIGTSVKDSVKGVDNDYDDWKAIEVKEAGKLRVMVLMGNPDCQCSLEFLSPDGKEITSYSKFKEQPRLDLIVDKAKPGFYVIHIKAKKEYDYSSYLIESSFRAAPKASTPDEDPVEPVASQPAVVEAKAVDAEIVKSKPGRAGFLVLTLDKGSKDGVAEGATGTIEGIADGTLTVIKVSEAECEAETKVDAKTIRGKKKATIQPKK